MKSNMINEPLTLGELIYYLDGVPQDNFLCFDFCRVIPTVINSYRLIPSQLAVGWSVSPRGVYVRDFLSLAKSTQNKVIKSYYGEDIQVNSFCWVFVSNWGDTNPTVVVGVTTDGVFTILRTKYVPSKDFIMLKRHLDK